MLLDMNKPTDALKEFEATLVEESNRFRSLYGAGRAAERAGDATHARMFYTSVVNLHGGYRASRAAGGKGVSGEVADGAAVGRPAPPPSR